MEISLRLDTLGMVEVRYLRGRERYREWPQFELLAASRQARVLAYFTHEVAEQLHQQILIVEAAVGLDVEDEEDEEDEVNGDESESNEGGISEKTSEAEGTAFSPAFAQTLKQLNELARQRLGGGSQAGGEAPSELEGGNEDDDALEQLQDAFVQMMEVVRELAEEMSTDALKVTGRFKCARTNIEFIPQPREEEDDEDDEDDDNDESEEIVTEDGVIDIEVELVMVLQLFEEGRARPDDPPAIELQLDVDDFERLHETLDFALERERRSRRRR
jgi:hypothetical protein